jgi:hypothetical protein
MSNYKIKMKPILFGYSDERAFGDLIRASFPKLVIVDGIQWVSPSPPLVDSIDQCRSSIALLWIKGHPESLPCLLNRDGYLGPQTKYVVRMLRCRRVESVINSGQLDASYDAMDSFMSGFVKESFKILNKLQTGTVRTPDGEIIRDYVIGAEAATFEGELRDRATQTPLAFVSKLA